MKSRLCNCCGLIFFMLIISTTSFGQVLKFKSTSFSSMYKINEYSWSDWEDPSESTVLMTFDLDNDRITIYSKVTQIYDVAKYEEKITDKDGDDIFSFFCVDNEGITCRVQWLILNSQNGRMQVYVYYSDIALLYNVYNLQ